jgi:hypothetical protein
VTLEQLEIVRAARERDLVRVIVVNDMYLVAPWADVVYFADFKWWKWHSDGVDKSWLWAKFSKSTVAAAFREFRGQKITIKHVPVAKGDDIFSLENGGTDGVSLDPFKIKTGGNSGYQAINIAALSGGNPILLVGYDMKFSGGRSHSHNGHSDTVRSAEEKVYEKYAKRFSSMENPLKTAGIRVVNCTPGSSIGAFEFGDLSNFLGGGPVSAYNGFLPLWTQVSETLWFGGTPEADLGGRYGRFKFIVDCVGIGGRYRRGDSALLIAPFPDSSPPPKLALVNALADFAIAGMRQGFTLIHCQQGNNRSALIAAAALVRAGICDKRQVVRFLREKRKPEVLSNSSFAKMIEEDM